MTREEALKSFEEENKDFDKTFERYGYQMSPEEVSAVKEAIERNKVAISALSTEGEYINKSDTIDLIEKWGEDVLLFIDDLPTYSLSAKSKVLEDIRAEIAEIPNKYPMTADYENGIREALSIVDKHLGGKDK